MFNNDNNDDNLLEIRVPIIHIHEVSCVRIIRIVYDGTVL